MNLNDVEEAAARIAREIRRTPVLRWDELDMAASAKIAVKAEFLQRTGSFKVRGACNKMLSLKPAELRKGVVSGSSGNHGSAVAELADHLGITAALIVPADISQAKLSAIRRYQADVVHYDPEREDREVLVEKLAVRSGRSIVASSDDPLVAAGHGTAALELFAEVGELDRLVVPVGGGGLAAGCATVAKALYPNIEVVGVEPVAGDDTARSLESGRRVRIPAPRTIADGLRHQMPGEFTFDVNRRLLDCIVTVTDTEIAVAMAFAWETARLKIEPSGCVALAAVHASRPEPAGLRVGVIASGGNITATSFDHIIENHLTRVNRTPGDGDGDSDGGVARGGRNDCHQSSNMLELFGAIRHGKELGMEQNNSSSATGPEGGKMTDLVGAVEDRINEIKAKIAQGDTVSEEDLRPLGEDVAQMFVQVSVIASWE